MSECVCGAHVHKDEQQQRQLTNRVQQLKKHTHIQFPELANRVEELDWGRQAEIQKRLKGGQ